MVYDIHVRPPTGIFIQNNTQANSFASLQEEEEEMKNMENESNMEQFADKTGNNGNDKNMRNAGQMEPAYPMQIPKKTVKWTENAPNTSFLEEINAKHHTVPMKHNSWIPIRLKWKDRNINKNSSIANPEINEENREDNTPTPNHPVINKINIFNNLAKNYSNDCQMRTGKNNDILDKCSLIKQQWSINKVKHTFDYIYDALRKQFVTTLLINIGQARDFEEFKGKLMRDLRFNNLYVEYHTGTMQDVATSSVGWFQGIYPDACDILH